MRLFAIILIFSAIASGCSQEMNQDETPDIVKTNEVSNAAELEVMNEYLESMEAKNSTAYSLGEENKDIQSMAQNTPSMDEDARDQVPELGNAESEELFARLDSLEAKVAASKAEAQAELDKLDRNFQARIESELAPNDWESPYWADRAPDCVAKTSAIFGNKNSRDLYPYLMGSIGLGLVREERIFLRDCAMKGDGLSLLTLVLDRVERSPFDGTPSPEWLLDALLTAGEYGAGSAGPLADDWIRNFAEEQYIENGLYLRLTNSERMSRLKPLVSYSEEREAGIDEMVANSSDIRTLIKDQQNKCWQAQQTYRSFPESGREKYEKILQEAAPKQEETCLLVGIEILYEGPLPHHSVEWAEGISKISFRAGDKLVQAKNVARLLDNWRKARTSNNWNSSYSNFVHFSDSSNNQYLAGYDPYSHRYGDTQMHTFRILRLDFGEIRETLNSYWQPDSDISHAEFGSIDEAREHAKKIMLALEPGLHFMMGHYEEEGLWDWSTLESDLMHPTAYAESIPFREYEVMLSEAQD